jgi:hypothetical protein
VAAAVAEAEASIHPIRGRHAQAAVRIWFNIHTLPERTHFLAIEKFGRLCDSHPRCRKSPVWQR